MEIITAILSIAFWLPVAALLRRLERQERARQEADDTTELTNSYLYREY